MIDRMAPNTRYAQAVRHGGLVYISGQIADDYEGNIVLQTGQVLAKLDTLLDQAGSDRTKLINCTVWIHDFADYAEYNRVWEQWIGPFVPARASIGATLLDPKVKIEIAAVAACPAAAPSSSKLVDAAKLETPEVNSSALKALQADGGTLVLDVRDSGELQSGMISGAVHVPRGMLEFTLDPSDENFLPAIAEADRLVFICGSGGRAALAAKLAKDMGWDALRLAGGMNAWRAAHGR